MAYKDFIERGSFSRWREVVKENNIITADLAKLHGVSVATINRWNNPSSDNVAPTHTFMTFCDHYDISPTWLLFGKGPKRLSTFGAPRQGMSEEIERRAQDIARQFDDLIRDFLNR